MHRLTPLGLAALALLLATCSDDKTGAIASESSASLCSDGRDNDGDGFTDCADQDCWSFAICAGADTRGGDTATVEPDVTSDARTGPDGDRAPDGTSATPDGGAGLCDPCGAGTVMGRVCAPNEHTYVSEALVVIDGTGCDGQLFHREVRSAADGSWAVTDVPCGLHNLVITKGSFVAASNVAVRAGDTTDLTGAGQKLCFLGSSTSIAVLAGNWDKIENLLAQLGLDYDLYNDDGTDGADGSLLDLLSDPEKLARYQILFADCGGKNGWMPQDHPEVMPNLKSWVLAGGSLYMSDYAWVYGEWAFPDAIEFQGSDSVFDMYTDKSPQLIPSDQTITATVVDGALASYLGKSTLTVTFDRGPQIAPDKAGPGTFAHVVGSFSRLLEIGTGFRASNVPLALSYVPAAGAGRVIYTNFHNDAQATSDMLTVLQYLVFTL